MSGDIVFGPFRLDVAGRTLTREDHAIGLAPRTLDVLIALVEHRARAVKKEELVQLVWKDAFVSDESVSQCISALRRALGDDPFKPAYIATLPRHGYRFIADVARREAHQSTEAPPLTAEAIPGEENARTITNSHVSRLTILLAVAAGTAAITWFATARRNEPARSAVRFNLEAEAASTITSGAALSPDGLCVAYVAEGPSTGPSSIRIRSLETGSVTALTGTDGAAKPFWSPDGAMIGFFADGALKITSRNGGLPRRLATVGPDARGGSWNSRGIILVALFRSGIFSLSESGGSLTRVTAPSEPRQERAHWWPQFLPDGKRFLYYVDAVDPKRGGTFIGSLDSPERTQIVPDVRAAYAPSGRLVWVRDHVLFARPFDPAYPTRLETASVVAEGVPNIAGGGDGFISAAANDRVTVGGGASSTLTWFDRNGRVVKALPLQVSGRGPSFSRDYQRLMVSGNTGVWSVDPAREVAALITARGIGPTLSADGSLVAFSSSRLDGIANLFVRKLGTEEDQLLVRSDKQKWVGDWSPDGERIVYVVGDSEANRDIWTVTLRDRTSAPYLRSDADELQPRISPDGQWLAYTSNESGSWEVYVQSFPQSGTKAVISVAGGAEPQWSPSGRELFYITPERMLAVATVESNGGTLKIAKPVELFRLPIDGSPLNVRRHYAVGPDARSFLVDTVGSQQRDPVVVLVDWSSASHPIGAR